MKTIDSICNLPAGSFKKFIEGEDEILRQMENDRKERIKKTRNMKKLTKTELEYLKSTALEIRSLEQLQARRYELMLSTLKLEDSEELFDICYNFGEIDQD